MKFLTFIAFLFFFQNCFAQRDTIIYNIKYVDTVIYIKRYIYVDTVGVSPHHASSNSSSNWGIGPTFGAYYSPYNGFDINIGFGIQYYMFNKFFNRTKNPHTGQKAKRK